MNQRQVIVLWAIALVLVVAVVLANASKSEAYESTTKLGRGDTLLSEFDPEQVAAIEIREGDDQVLLEKNDGAWVVDNRDDYPANLRNVHELLREVSEVKVTQGIEADPSFAPRFGMDPEGESAEELGTELVFRNDAGTELARLTFGKNLEAASNPMNPYGGGSTGRFVRNHADESGIYVTSELFPALQAEATRWLAEDFLKVQKIESVRVSEPGKPDETAWTLSREDEAMDFSLEGKTETEALDTTATNPIKNLFSYTRFEDVVPATEVAEAWQEDQKRQAVIETFEGLTYTIEFGPKKLTGDAEEGAEPYLMTVAVAGEIPAERKKGEDETEEKAKELDDAFTERKTALEEALATAKALEGRSYQVTKYTVDALLKARADLLQKPAAAGAASGATPAIPGMNPQPRARAVTPPIAVPPLPPAGGE